MRKNCRITQREIALKSDVSESSIKYHVMILKKKGLLKREGTIHSGQWKIMNRKI